MVNRDKLKHRISRNANPDLVIREPMDIFQQHMREIEDEMIEEYFYTTDNPRANSSPAYEIITLVLDYVCEFTHPNVYRVIHILLHVLSTQEYKFIIQDSPRPYADKDDWKKPDVILYAACWVEYYYRVYETASHTLFRTGSIREEIKTMFNIQNQISAAGNDLSSDNVVSNPSTAFPVKCKEFLDKKMEGQEQAKIIFSIALYRFVQLDKPAPLLLIGPTGCGKSFLLENAVQFLKHEGIDIPYLRADISSVTPAGFEGDSMKNIMDSFQKMCSQKKMQHPKGILFLDEADKILKPLPDSNHNDFHLHIQHQILSLIDGSMFPDSKIWVILGGAFTSLDDIVKFTESHHPIGFTVSMDSTEKPKYQTDSIRNKLEKWGAAPELLGRIQQIAVLDELNAQQLRNILCREIAKKQREFRGLGLHISFDSKAIDTMLDRMLEEHLGARSAANIMEEILSCIEYDMIRTGCNELQITREFLLGNEEPDFSNTKGGEIK